LDRRGHGNGFFAVGYLSIEPVNSRGVSSSSDALRQDPASERAIAVLTRVSSGSTASGKTSAM
jgi:hypothetical protein